MAETIAALVERICTTRPKTGNRSLIALAGAPGSGKSTLAEELVLGLKAAGVEAMVLPMDGFHLDNAVLRDLGLLDRKGSPDTFDINGLRRIVSALREDESVAVPRFDRSRDIAIAGAALVPDSCTYVICEGNYLLLDAPGWRDLAAVWDMSIWLEVDMTELHTRLVQRWLDHDLTPTAAQQRAEHNDLPNARRACAESIKADIIFGGTA